MKTSVGDTVKRIRFVVTGDLERKAITVSISALFPQTASDGKPVEWLRAQKVQAATTHRLTASAEPSRTMKKLAHRVIAEAAEGEDGSPADLVIAVDDLELHNFDQPEVVCDHFKRAMELEIEDRKLSQAAEQRLRAHIRERCRFHLEHLVERNGGFYDEVLGGNEALKALDWHWVASGAQSMSFARAFFEDVADFLGVSNPLGQGEPASFTYPERKVDRSKLLLRNL